MKRRLTLLRLARAMAFVIFISAAQARSAAQTKLPPAREVVAPAAYVSLTPVPRGRAFQIAVVLNIRPGFHINARKASAEYLIPTDLRADLPAGFRAAATSYPKGTLRKFSFSASKPLNVYTGAVVIRLPLTALADAPLGAQRVPMKLRYQACSDEVCLPPVTLDVEAVFDVASAGAAAKPAHAELFPK